MGGLFSSHSVDSSAPVISSIQLQTSSFGRPITWIFGRQRVAPNLIQYDDFTAIPHTTKQKTGKGGGGGTASTDYTYSVAAIMALGSGTLESIGKVWKDKEHSSLRELKFDFYSGDEVQEPYPYFVTKHPERALSYRGISYVASGAYDLGSNASFGNHTFEVQARGSIAANHAGSDVPDAELADVVMALLTDPEQGVGIDAATLGDMAGFRSFCLANSLWVSPAYTEQRGAFEYIKNLLTIGFSDCVYSGGKFKIVPYSDVPATGSLATYTPTIAPAVDLDEDDFISDESTDAIRIKQKSAEESYNHVRVKFADRANDYNDNIAESKDAADIEQHGLRSMDVVDLKEIADAAVAQKVADYLLHRALYILNTYEFRLPWKHVLLEPMDVVTLNYPRQFLNGTPVLITEISEDDDGLLTVTAEDYPLGSNSHASQPVPDIGNTAPNYAVPPGDVNTPVMFEPPAKLTGNESQLFMAASGGKDWGGAVVWASTDDKSYQRIGMIRAKAKHGVLTEPIAAGADLDTVNALQVDLSVSGGELMGATEENARDLLTTSYVGGEYIAFANEALTGSNAYRLSYLVRGAYGSDVAAHAAGTPFVFLDTAVFRYSYPREWVGRTLYFKLASFNQFGGAQQDLSAVRAYPHTLAGGQVPDVTYLNAISRVFGIELDWGLPVASSDHLQYTELWASATPNRGHATKLDSFAAPQNSFTITGLRAGVVMYFWVRVADKMGNVGDFFPAGDGVKGQTSSDADEILSYLVGAIGKTQLAGEILAPIEAAEEIIGPVMDKINAILHGGQNEDLAATQLLGAISADKALTDARDKLKDNIAAQVAEEKAERVTSTDALATQVSTVAATTAGNTALIQEEQIARTTALESVASKLNIVAVNVGKNTADIQTEQTARATANSAMASRIDLVAATTGQNTAAILSEQTARANSDGALSTRIDAVVAQSNSNAAAITSEQSARANADGALGTRIDTVTATANGASASAQAASTAIANTNGKLAAMYTIKAQTTANGRTYLASLGVGVENNNGVIESQILLSAARVAIIDESSGSLKAPFVVQGGQVFMNEAFIGSASIGSAQIKTAAVDTLTIAGNAVTFMQGASSTSGSFTSNASCQIRVTTHGAPVMLITCGVGSYVGSTAGSAQVSVSISRDGAQITSLGASGAWGAGNGAYANVSATPVFIDYPGAGDHVYTFTVTTGGGSTGDDAQPYQFSINAALLETRR